MLQRNEFLRVVSGAISAALGTQPQKLGISEAG